MEGLCDLVKENEGWRNFFERRTALLDYDSKVLSKEEIVNLLSNKDIKNDELVDDARFTLKFRNFDFCISVTREVWLNRDRYKKILTDGEELVGFEIRKKYDRKTIDTIQSILRTNGVEHIWRLVDREWGIYFLLFNQKTIDLNTDMNNINMG